jgi:hypothetical protein
MKINGNQNWKYQVIIEALGDKQLYTFPSKDAMDIGIRMYSEIFPFINIQVIKCGDDSVPAELLIVNKFQLN